MTAPIRVRVSWGGGGAARVTYPLGGGRDAVVDADSISAAIGTIKEAVTDDYPRGEVSVYVDGWGGIWVEWTRIGGGGA